MRRISYPFQTTQQVVDDNLPEARLLNEYLTAQIEHDIGVAPAPKPVTVDGWLREHQRAQTTRMLRQIAEELALSEAMFPRPINERIADGAATRRARYADSHRWFKRYRGAHRVGCWSVDALTEAVIAQRSADRAAHRASLRYPAKPTTPVWIGDRMIEVQFYPLPTDPDYPTSTATLTITPDDNVLVSLPLIGGPADVPWTKVHTEQDVDVDTGPMVPPVGKFAGYRQVSDEEARRADPTWTPVPELQWPTQPYDEALAKVLDDEPVVANYVRWMPDDHPTGRHGVGIGVEGIRALVDGTHPRRDPRPEEGPPC